TYEFNLTTIVVTHDMNSVMEIGDYIMFMYQGHNLWEGSNENIIESEIKELQDFMFANKLIRTLKSRSH
ncbi:MAG: ABC transporter ATP-binding protein, partial [Bacteroidetes bacterium]|nr:ABC transporter ATP-binding protein [Bacteroidota bacterium]